MEFADAVERARAVRAFYARLEVEHHGHEWSEAEMVVGLDQDVGDLGRLTMAAEGRWTHGEDVATELGYELAECLWWIFALADRLAVDVETAYAAFIEERRRRLA
jgi:NTP pyrophosphatase (non-canonical NTP hydrolase)